MLSMRTRRSTVHAQYWAATPVRGVLVKLLHLSLVLVWVTFTVVLLSLQYDTHSSKPEYIVSQAPLVDTVGDFWQMVWEQSVSVIVMLTALSDRGMVGVDMRVWGGLVVRALRYWWVGGWVGVRVWGCGCVWGSDSNWRACTYACRSVRVWHMCCSLFILLPYSGVVLCPPLCLPPITASVLPVLAFSRIASVRAIQGWCDVHTYVCVYAHTRTLTQTHGHAHTRTHGYKHGRRHWQGPTHTRGARKARRSLCSSCLKEHNHPMCIEFHSYVASPLLFLHRCNWSQNTCSVSTMLWGASMFRIQRCEKIDVKLCTCIHTWQDVRFSMCSGRM